MYQVVVASRSERPSHQSTSVALPDLPTYEGLVTVNCDARPRTYLPTYLIFRYLNHEKSSASAETTYLQYLQYLSVSAVVPTYRYCRGCKSYGTKRAKVLENRLPKTIVGAIVGPSCPPAYAYASCVSKSTTLKSLDDRTHAIIRNSTKFQRVDPRVSAKPRSS